MKDKSPSAVKVYIYLLASVNTQPKKFDWGVCERGATFISQNNLSKELNLSVNTIRKALNDLEAGGEIKRVVIDQNHIKIYVPKFNNYQNGGISNFDTPSKNDIAKIDIPVYQKMTPNKNIYNKKGEDNNAHTHMRTHEAIIDDMLKSQSMIEAYCKNEGITLDQFKQLAEAIKVEWSLTGEHYNTESETKQRILAHIRAKAQAMNMQSATINERKSKFVAECKDLIAKGYPKSEVAEFATYYSQPTADGRMLFETYKGWDTLTRFLINRKQRKAQ